jgi:hypothetical protein
MRTAFCVYIAHDLQERLRGCLIIIFLWEKGRASINSERRILDEMKIRQKKDKFSFFYQNSERSSLLEEIFLALLFFQYFSLSSLSNIHIFR